MPTSPRRQEAAFWLAAILVLAASLIIAPRVWLPMDFETYWLPWARSTGGTAPWAMYLRTFPTEAGDRACNYPPLVPYLLTLAEAVRRALGAPAVGGTAVTAVKLPFLLAHIAGAALCRYGLRRPFGREGAATAGWLYLLCPPLLYNAAVWGQADCLLCLALVAAVTALLHGRPVLCGALLGLALIVKAQSVALVPVLFIALRRGAGPETTLRAMLAAMLAAGAVFLPYVVAGAGAEAWAGATGGVDYYPFRQVNMHNPWFLLDWAQQAVSSKGTFGLVPDWEPAVGPVSWKQIGMLLLGGYLLGLCGTLWRRLPRIGPEQRRALLVLALVASAFAFSMLPTQMHGRYLLPGLALAALAWPAVPTARPLFLVWSVTCLIDQWLVLTFGHRGTSFRPADSPTSPPVLIGLALSLVHTGQFLWTTVSLGRRSFGELGIDRS